VLSAPATEVVLEEASNQWTKTSINTQTRNDVSDTAPTHAVSNELGGSSDSTCFEGADSTQHFGPKSVMPTKRLIISVDYGTASTGTKAHLSSIVCFRDLAARFLIKYLGRSCCFIGKLKTSETLRYQGLYGMARG
jgi:hypothetical protein